MAATIRFPASAVKEDGGPTLVDCKPTGNPVEERSGTAKSLAYRPSSGTLFVLHSFGPDHLRLMSVDDEGNLKPSQERYTGNTKDKTDRVPTILSLAVVDDDESVRESLLDLLREFGFAAHAFSSAEEFLASDSLAETRCLILDVAMLGMNGLDLQRELKIRAHEIPIIFITAQKDEAIRARAFEQGAAEFLLKPFSDTTLLAALNIALGGR
jgi:CheY-like chemotaxis protein